MKNFIITYYYMYSSGTYPGGLGYEQPEEHAPYDNLSLYLGIDHLEIFR